MAVLTPPLPHYQKVIMFRHTHARAQFSLAISHFVSQTLKMVERQVVVGFFFFPSVWFPWVSERRVITFKM